MRKKDSCWSMGMIDYGSKGLAGISTVGPRSGRGVTETNRPKCAQL